MSDSPAPEPLAVVGGNSISCAEIVKGRDSTVRVTVDGLIYAVDLVMVVTGKNRNDAGQAIRNLDTDIFSSVNFPFFTTTFIPV